MEAKTRLYICEVEHVNDENFDLRKEWTICNAENYAECTHEIEYMYGVDNIISMKMFALEEGPITITKDLAKRFMETEWGEPVD